MNSQRTEILISNYNNILRQLQGKNAALIAVSKTWPVEDIKVLYEAGHRDFGENKVQEMLAKVPELPNDIQWHLIGHLQTNKVKQVVDKAWMIHAVDSLKLMAEIQKQAQKRNLTVQVLLQVYIAQEETKFGLDPAEAMELLSSRSQFPDVKVCGLMGMATNTDDTAQVRREFDGLKAFYDSLRNGEMKDEPYFRHLSMGMTGDFPIALEAGSTLVRVGSAIFGERDYTPEQ